MSTYNVRAIVGDRAMLFLALVSAGMPMTGEANAYAVRPVTYATTGESGSVPIILSEEQLTIWAQSNRPPQSWYEHDESDLK